MSDRQDLEKIEMELLLEGILKYYGYDFRDYASASLKRRLQHALVIFKCNNYVELLNKILNSKEEFEKLLSNLSIVVTEMFRDPEVYQLVHQHVIPLLKTYPYIKIWHAGCASGEEAYSIAILLHEEKLLEKTHIYATDINMSALEKGREGIYPMDEIEKYEKNYVMAGGKSSFKNYYYAKYGSVKMENFLKEHITFAYHNLAVDYSFCEVQMVVCRNVMIYFNQKLQSRALNLFNESLSPGGFLFLGTKESLRFSDLENQFKCIVPMQRLYQKCYASKENINE